MKNKSEKILKPEKMQEDRILDLNLRPKTLAEFIGQEKFKKNLEIFITAAKKRKEPVEHILLYGGPGLGKTTISFIIAQEMNTKIRITSGPVIEKTGDLAAILTSLEEGEILFIDEIHRLSPIVEEVLYPAMEEYALDLVTGRGPMTETIRLNLAHFTLIGATTRPSLLTPPLRDRFGVTYNLDFYEEKEIEKIIQRSAKILKINLTSGAIREIAKRARKTPRIANRLLKRVRDYAQVKEKKIIDHQTAIEALNLLDIDKFGLTPTDLKILEVIIKKFQGGPVGLKTLAAAVNEEDETIEEIYEPYLMRLGFLEKTPRGRIVSREAYHHLNLSPVRLL